MLPNSAAEVKGNLPVAFTDRETTRGFEDIIREAMRKARGRDDAWRLFVEQTSRTQIYQWGMARKAMGDDRPKVEAKLRKQQEVPESALPKGRRFLEDLALKMYIETRSCRLVAESLGRSLKMTRRMVREAIVRAWDTGREIAVDGGQTFRVVADRYRGQSPRVGLTYRIETARRSECCAAEVRQMVEEVDVTPHERWWARQKKAGIAWSTCPPDLPISSQPVHREERGFEAPMPELIRRYGSGGFEEVFAHATLGQVRRFQQIGLEVVVDTTTGLGYGLDGGVTQIFDRPASPAFTGASGTVEVEPGNEVPLFFFDGLDYREGGFWLSRGRALELTDREKHLRRNGRNSKKEPAWC